MTNVINLIRVHSLQLAQIYLSEFEEMFVEGVFGRGSDRDPVGHIFTDDTLAAALVEARERGLNVVGVMDASQARSNAGSDHEFFLQNGLDVRLDDRSGKLHHKVLIIDGEIVVAGSYNFTRNARTSNDENTLIVYDKDVADVYLGEFQRILSGWP